jgi:N-acetyltransferase
MTPILEPNMSPPLPPSEDETSLRRPETPPVVDDSSIFATPGRSNNLDQQATTPSVLAAVASILDEGDGNHDNGPTNTCHSSIPLAPKVPETTMHRPPPLPTPEAETPKKRTGTLLATAVTLIDLVSCTPCLQPCESNVKRKTRTDSACRPPLPPRPPMAPRKEISTNRLARTTTTGTTDATAAPSTSGSAVTSTKDTQLDRPAHPLNSNTSTLTPIHPPNHDATVTVEAAGAPIKKPLAQLFLDFGQKSFGQRTLCDICGMLYDKRLAEDKQEHDKLCRNYALGIPFQTHEGRVVARFTATAAIPVGGGDCIVEIRPNDSSSLLKKREQVQRIVDQELGAAPSEETSKKHTINSYHALQPSFKKRRRRAATNHNNNNTAASTTAYLYIRDKRVVGMVTAEQISHAYRAKNQWERDTIPISSAKVGIRHLWVHRRARKLGIATRLVDAVQCKFIFGWMVPKGQLAFSSPTQSGHAFAQRYCFGKITRTTEEEEEADDEKNWPSGTSQRNILVYESNCTTAFSGGGH